MPVSKCRKIVSALGWFLALLFLIELLLCGCSSSRGVNVVASSAYSANILDVSWEEYKLPVFSIISGPRSTVWVNKEYLELQRVRAGGVVTNNTSALGIYLDQSSRENFIELEFKVSDGTNVCIRTENR